MENGITYSVGEVTDKHVTVIERIDLAHPDCPVVCFDKSAAIIERRYPMSPMDYQAKFGHPPEPQAPALSDRQTKP